ncbi:tRNA (adenosine(37)-N6)-dimethylallyltransferase MiaA [Kocuria sp.]|uniref:tRNA (adenosine(37)-N6)-dimethylallyltransferase MiaA n=1 Tax=Kocuria sp. TaxID=1871328 RepID=UPI0026E01EA6|nr:tRNA (adenosine(37)-N6)-dimethylallyltransferase MiaA [Kocuria sp.]MDO5618734.1 tRNA (adenosine(37)-N6)-dimethylallyltransferase MiaA [Kocuria sp.]
MTGPEPPELPVVALVGPTGTGKTALSVRLARELNGEVVNADAMQFYRGMDIGTAKATVQERDGVAHHLLDIMDVTQEASVAVFQEQARQCFAQIRARGKLPILVGGSGLYVRAALDHMEFPGTDPEIRAGLEAELHQHGPGALRARLQEVDPESASRIKDDRRLVRALEVHHVTGRPFTSFMPQRSYVQPTVQIALDLERDVLYNRLTDRVAHMVEVGLEAEVRALIPQGLREGKTASRALGYGQFLNVVDGTMSRQQAVESTVVATRQFAKRQLTWFRADPRVQWLPAHDPLLVNRAVELIRATSPAD